MLQSCHPRASLAWNCFSAVVGTGKRSQRLWCILRDHNNLPDHIIRRTVRLPSFRFQQFLSVMNYCPASVVWAHIMHFPTPRSTYQLRAIPAMWMDHNLYWAHAFWGIRFEIRHRSIDSVHSALFKSRFSPPTVRTASSQNENEGPGVCVSRRRPLWGNIAKAVAHPRAQQQRTVLLKSLLGPQEAVQRCDNYRWSNDIWQGRLSSAPANQGRTMHILLTSKSACLRSSWTWRH